MKTETIAALVADPGNPDNAETAARVYAAPPLWPEFERVLYSDAEPTDEERETIRRVVSERCDGALRRRQAFLRDFVANRLDRISGGMRDFALAAASSDVRRRDAACPEAESVTFVFVSEASDGLMGAHAAWRAEMTLPPDAEVDEMLPIAITDGAGEPIPGGVFTVAGAALPVARGRAEIPYGMFLAGLKDANVELTDPAGVRTRGTLALF